MTILENDVIPRQRNKLSLYKRKIDNSAVAESLVPPKKQLLNNMLNGYRSDQANNGEAVQDSPVATLSNMGNTCYLNSVLYTLRFAPTFLHNLHHLIGDLAFINNRLNQNRAKTSSLGRNIGALANTHSSSSKDLLSIGNSNDFLPKLEVQIVTERLHELYMTMHNLEIKESTDPYQPSAVLQAVREANSICEGNHQQDAHELLVYLLDNIRETCELLSQQVHQNPELLTDSEPQPQPNHSKIWNVTKSWKRNYLKKDKSAKEAINEEHDNGSSTTDTEDAEAGLSGNEGGRRRIVYNFVAEDFEGITLQRTKCLECESVTERKEPFYDIPVPISLKESDLEGMKCMDPNEIYRNACVTSEKLCDANKYLCEKCKRYNEARRDVLFKKLPNIMVLQLKRFTSSSVGIQKVNTYLPTPLQLACFCESCSLQVDKSIRSDHQYQLCCVIMHLGGTMASGHYIAYVKASASNLNDYRDCARDLPKTSLSASSSEKSLNLLKYLKPRSLANTMLDNKNGLLTKNAMNGLHLCKSIDCCGVKLNKSVLENNITYSKKAGQDYLNGASPVEDMWLECDDETVRPITSDELKDVLGYKPNSTSTPYLLFYSKISD